MQKYKPKENTEIKYKKNLTKKVIDELQTTSSKISDIENLCYKVDNCDCPSCGCTEAEFLYVLAPGGMVATTPIMLLAVAADAVGS